MTRETDDYIGFGIMFLIAIGILAFAFKDYIPWDKIKFIVYISLGVIIIGYIIYRVIRNIYESHSSRKGAEATYLSLAKGKFREHLEKASKRNFRSSSEIGETIEKLEEDLENCDYKDLQEKYSELISELEEKKDELEDEEQVEQNKLELATEQREEIFQFFMKKRSCDTIPEFAIYYDEEVIKRAREKFENFQKMSKEQNAIREEATEFITKHGAFPVEFAGMRPVEKSIYQEVFSQYKSGSIVSIHKVKHSDRELFKKGFVIASSLIKPLQERFVSEYGFRKIFFTGLDGKGEYVLVRNDTRKESDYHFCWKQTFGSLPKAEIEKDIDGWRTDVAFAFKGKSVALEIETGKNNKEQVLDKKDWLNRHFDLWCFVCQRKDVAKYRNLVDKKKSFVFTTGEAYAWLISLNKG